MKLSIGRGTLLGALFWDAFLEPLARVTPVSLRYSERARDVRMSRHQPVQWYGKLHAAR